MEKLQGLFVSMSRSPVTSQGHEARHAALIKIGYTHIAAIPMRVTKHRPRAGLRMAK